MKKVVHLITLLEFGGAQGNTIHTVRNLDSKRFEAHLWCGSGAYWDQEMTQELGPSKRIHFFPNLIRDAHPLKDLLIVFDLFHAFKEIKPDIVHTHSSKAGIVGRLAAHWAKVPFIVHTFHGFGFNNQQKPWTRWFYVMLERMAAKWAHKLIFVSLANMDEASKLDIGTSPQYQLIRSGVPIATIRKKGSHIDAGKTKTELGIPTNHKVVTTISAFKPQKNLVDFIDVAAKVIAHRPDTTFILLGDGTMRAELESQARKKGINDRIKMPGWRENATDILAASDVFVLTSLWEGLPRALVEAMILGKPSVCYDTDGVRDLLPKGGGMTVTPRDTRKMSEHVVQILSDPTLAVKLSNQAKTLITDEFDIDEMVRTQEKLYEQNHF